MKNKAFLLILSLLAFGTATTFCATAAPEAATAGLAFDATKRWDLSEETLEHMKDAEHIARRNDSAVDPALRAIAQSALGAAKINPSIVVRHLYKDQPSFLVPIYDDATGLPAFFYTLSPSEAGYYCVTTFLTPEMALNSAGENRAIIERLIDDASIYDAIKKKQTARTVALRAADAETAKDLTARAEALRLTDAAAREADAAAGREKMDAQKKLYAELSTLIKTARNRLETLTQIKGSGTTVDTNDLVYRLCCFYAARETLKHAPDNANNKEIPASVNLEEFRILLRDEPTISAPNKEKINNLLAWVNDEHSTAPRPAPAVPKKQPQVAASKPTQKTSKATEKAQKKAIEEQEKMPFFERALPLKLLPIADPKIKSTIDEQLQSIATMQTIINDRCREYTALVKEYEATAINVLRTEDQAQKAKEDLQKPRPTFTLNLHSIREGYVTLQNKKQVLQNQLAFIEKIAWNSASEDIRSSLITNFKKLTSQLQETLQSTLFAERIIIQEELLKSDTYLDELYEERRRLIADAASLQAQIDTIIERCATTCTLPTRKEDIETAERAAEAHHQEGITPTQKELTTLYLKLQTELTQYREKVDKLETEKSTLTPATRKYEIIGNLLKTIQEKGAPIYNDMQAVAKALRPGQTSQQIWEALSKMQSETEFNALCIAGEERFTRSTTFSLTDKS
ncbi:MAG: hypothetical protein QG632_36 [Candidatus Dependentiae bacterium]|nr:hypothetical protein [Candidatus Dependentiae bacterium]